MKAHYKTANGRLVFEIQGETVKDVFKQISSVQEVFDADQTCGACGQENIRFLQRNVDDFDFYELACGDCFARLAFGQAKKGGGLFPKRKDTDGKYLPDRGWLKYKAPSKPGNSVPINEYDQRIPGGISDDDVPF